MRSLRGLGFFFMLLGLGGCSSALFKDESKRTFLQSGAGLHRTALDGENFQKEPVQTLCSNRGTKNSGTNVQLASGVAFKFYDPQLQEVVAIISDPALAAPTRDYILNRKNLIVPRGIPDGDYFVALCDQTHLATCVADSELAEEFAEELDALKHGSKGLIGAISHLRAKGGEAVVVQNAGVLLRDAKFSRTERSLAGGVVIAEGAIDGASSPRDDGQAGDGSASGNGNSAGAGSASGNGDEAGGDGGIAGNEQGVDSSSCDDISSPLIVDFSPQGVIELTPPTEGVRFDIDGNGTLDQISWPQKVSTMLLVLDRNKNGQIDNVDELFGNNTLGPDGTLASNGFTALAKYDANADGFIDATDPVYGELRFWSDRNIDARVDEHELYTLDFLNTKSIDLGYSELNQEDDYGNQTRQRSVIITNDNDYRVILDIWFRLL